jgi:inner membrane protein
VENLTHTLFGAALAGMALRLDATRTDQRLFVAAGAVAANLPDIDILYTAITPAPLGYLLHHRGHTHTFAGAAIQAALVVLALSIIPAVRALSGRDRTQLWMLVLAGVVSHVLLDWANSYGVHPFYPVDNRWYYGDALFVIEPVFWVLLGVAVAANARTTWGRWVSRGIVVLLPLIAAVAGVVSWAALVVLGALGWGLAWAIAHRPPPIRAAVAVTLCVVFTLAMSGVSRAARAEVRETLETPAGRVVADIVMTPNPSSPACWGIIVVEHDVLADEMTLRRGSFSLAPALRRPEACALHARPGRNAIATNTDGRIVWSDEIVQSLADLRELRRRDCRIDAWLRFGRAPVIANGSIYDLRFDNGLASNFSAMSVDDGNVDLPCPPFVPPWGQPRSDLVDRWP